MKQTKNFVRQTIKRVVQRMLQRELTEWPPDCIGLHYQPRRPEAIVAESVQKRAK